MMKRVRVIQYLPLFLAALFTGVGTGNAAERGTSGDTSMTIGRTIHDSSPPPFPQPVKAPEGAPNIVVILLDDVGFGQLSVTGGGVSAPSLEALADSGLTYNRFHTVGICSPTRAALLTGRNHHNAGFGLVAELATSYPGYTGLLSEDTATVAKVLSQNGYSTAMFGKNHNTPPWEISPSGPFDRWPTAFGFDYFYGFQGWGTSQWQPALWENTRPVTLPEDPDYHLTKDLADRAIQWVRERKAIDQDKPFFLYLATGAIHAPHHAPKEWIDRFEGRFDGGWDRYREETFARQKHLGVIPADTQLTPRPRDIPAWDSLSAEQKRIYVRQMEVAAGFAAHTDHEVGRLIEAVRDLPDGDNTLIVYIVGDNGASAEGGPDGGLNEIASANGMDEKLENFTPEVLEKLGGPEFNNNYPIGWAWAMGTPFQYYKQVVSHFGGTRNPMIVSWPERIKKAGLRSQFSHVVDIAPTLLEVAGLEMPDAVDGVRQRGLDGKSLVTSFTNPEVPGRPTQYFEVFSNRAIYHDGWVAASKLVNPWESNRDHLDPDKASWELYHVDEDFSQARNLAAEHPDKLARLQALWWAEADRNQVLPLDWRTHSRLSGSIGERYNPARNRKAFTFYPGMSGLAEGLSPQFKNRSWRIRAEGDFSGADSGILLATGGLSGGFALFVGDGRPVFEYNYGLEDLYRIESDTPLPDGAATIAAHFDYAGTARELGAGGRVTLLVDGKVVGRGELPKTLLGMFAVDQGLDIGLDHGSAVSSSYRPPFRFTGDLQRVIVELK